MRAHGTRSSALFDIASWMGELPFEYPKSMSDGSTAAAAHGTGPSHSLSRWCSCRALWSSVYDRGQRRAAQRRPLAVCSVEYGLFWLLFLARGPRIRPARACGSSSAAAAAQRKGRQAGCRSTCRSPLPPPWSSWLDRVCFRSCSTRPGARPCLDS